MVVHTQVMRQLRGHDGRRDEDAEKEPEKEGEIKRRRRKNYEKGVKDSLYRYFSSFPFFLVVSRRCVWRFHHFFRDCGPAEGEGMAIKGICWNAV